MKELEDSCNIYKVSVTEKLEICPAKGEQKRGYFVSLRFSSLKKEVFRSTFFIY